MECGNAVVRGTAWYSSCGWADQTAQTTTAPFVSYSIKFEGIMYLYIHIFYYTSYFENFLLIIYKLM
jgi:hypothetical protein